MMMRGCVLPTPEGPPQSLDDMVRRGAGQCVLCVEIDPPREPLLVRVRKLLARYGPRLGDGAAVISAEERARSLFRSIIALFRVDFQVSRDETVLGHAQMGRDPGNVLSSESWLDRLAAVRTSGTVDPREDLLVHFPGEYIDAVGVGYHLEASQETEVGILLPGRVLPQFWSIRS